jgi:hypothetical protein
MGDGQASTRFDEVDISMTTIILSDISMMQINQIFIKKNLSVEFDQGKSPTVDGRVGVIQQSVEFQQRKSSMANGMIVGNQLIWKSVRVIKEK